MAQGLGVRARGGRFARPRRRDELRLDPRRRAAMGRAGRARAESLTLERQTDLWEELYEEVLDEPPRGSPLRLLEVGVDWPPEAFLARKLQGLHERGVRVA